MEEVTEITLQNGVVRNVKTISEEKTSLVSSYNNEPQIKVVEAIEHVQSEEIEYDTYPPPDQDFVYEDPYVTEEELRLISSTNPQQSLKLWPRKPASGYFYFAKQHRARLQEEHPTWPMKKIMILVASLWKNTSEEGREFFIDKAKCDSDRYKTEMKAFSQTEIYKKHKKLQKKHRRLKQRIKGQTSKEISLQAAFDLFAKDHGGTLEQIKALWDEETDDIIRNEYIAKAQTLCKEKIENQTSLGPVLSTRSKRQIKLPSKLSSRSSTISKLRTPFDNFIKARKNSFSKQKISKAKMLNLLKTEWQSMNNEDKQKYSNATVDYKALDEGNIHFDEEEDTDSE